MKIKGIDDLNRIREGGRKKLFPPEGKIVVGMATCGRACGAEDVFSALLEEKKKRGWDIVVGKTGCLGFCQQEPILEIRSSAETGRRIYGPMDAKKASSLVAQLAEGRMPEENLLGIIEDDQINIDFYRNQKRLVSANCGLIDPESIEEYMATSGYFSLYKVLSTMQPEEVVKELKRSGLRGRGGGGFPTGRKWEAARKAKGEPKYVICNADEGDPGAYMDRSLLEGNPHLVLEGMIIGAYAIGSSEGYVYVRNEYPLAVKNVGAVIEQAKEYGLLGQNIIGSGFNFDVKIVRGGGAFVCGESTALFASIEGRIGEPRAKYVRSAEKGLWDKPTNLNNVETWANVPLIIEKGADWYTKIGTENSKGTKIFSLVGKINNTGLVEVPMGITLSEIIFDIGGGIPNKRKFKAVQTGGPSGGCITEEYLDLPVDFDELTRVGSMMGSGGMIVMDDRTCMVDIARYFLRFLKEESCGKCVPCREGVVRMYEILSDICAGKGKESDIELLEELSSVIKKAALCGLGNTAPNPVISTIRYFRDEYEAHITEKRCPAGVCKELTTFIINAETCTGCTLCAKNCPTGAITGEKKSPHIIDQAGCIKCGVCFDSCKFEAVEIR